MFLTIFVKKSFFFGAKKKFDGNFFIEITKKSKKLLYQMKVGMFIGKVKKFGISRCIPHRMAADNAKGGVWPDSPPAPYRVNLFKQLIPSFFLSVV